MRRALPDLVERQILRAEKSGQLSGLKGEGKPLPEEFKLQKALEAARARYPTLTGQAARRAAQEEIADLEMRANMAREARRKFLR